MECPKCKSDNTQRLEMIYDQGTQNIQTTTVGGGYGRGPAIGTASTRGKSQSKQAAKAAPPGKPSWFPIVALTFVGIFSVGFYYVGFAIIGLAIYLGIKTSQAKKIYPGLYQHWLNSWMCHKCGEIYQQV